MDRNIIIRNGRLGLLVATVILFTASFGFGAITPVNSYFGSGDLDLTDWEYSHNDGVIWSPVSLSNDGTGSAQLQQSDDDSLSTLELDFSMNIDSETIPETLTFNLRTPQWGVSETDYLYINLLDAHGDSLFGIDNGFIQWSSEEGVFDGSDDVTFVEAPDGPGFLSYLITVPVSPLWVNDYVTLRFTLDSNPDDNFPSIILVDNVVLHGTSSTPVVPIPGAMGLTLAGLMLLGFFKKKLS